MIPVNYVPGNVQLVRFHSTWKITGIYIIDKQNWRNSEGFCHQQPNTGTGKLDLPRWYFDNESTDCHSFAYKGIGGNKNRFTKREICLAACSQRAYPLKQSPPPLSKNYFGIDNK